MPRILRSSRSVQPQSHAYTGKKVTHVTWMDARRRTEFVDVTRFGQAWGNLRRAGYSGVLTVVWAHVSVQRGSAISIDIPGLVFDGSTRETR